jgi:4-diphosphocytidyl-2C-methyl-D-erythritol kinase
LLNNTFLPYRYAYELEVRKNHTNSKKVLRMMQQIPAEDNSIIRQWRTLGQTVENAADTQALIHLYQHYCQHERCIQCEVGQKVFAL